MSTAALPIIETFDDMVRRLAMERLTKALDHAPYRDGYAEPTVQSLVQTLDILRAVQVMTVKDATSVGFNTLGSAIRSVDDRLKGFFGPPEAVQTATAVVYDERSAAA